MLKFNDKYYKSEEISFLILSGLQSTKPKFYYASEPIWSKTKPNPIFYQIIFVFWFELNNGRPVFSHMNLEENLC